jgi:hypothetical protein
MLYKIVSKFLSMKKVPIEAQISFVEVRDSFMDTTYSNKFFYLFGSMAFFILLTAVNNSVGWYVLLLAYIAVLIVSKVTKNREVETVLKSIVVFLCGVWLFMVGIRTMKIDLDIFTVFGYFLCTLIVGMLVVRAIFIAHVRKVKKGTFMDDKEKRKFLESLAVPLGLSAVSIGKLITMFNSSIKHFFVNDAVFAFLLYTAPFAFAFGSVCIIALRVLEINIGKSGVLLEEKKGKHAM